MSLELAGLQVHQYHSSFSIHCHSYRQYSNTAGERRASAYQTSVVGCDPIFLLDHHPYELILKKTLLWFCECFSDFQWPFKRDSNLDTRLTGTAKMHASSW